LYIAHGADSLISPEQSIEGYTASLGYGAKAVDCDIHLLSDSGLAVMHDSTVDASTTSTGNVSSFNTAAWAALNIDALTWHGTYSNTLHPPLFGDVTSLVAPSRAILVYETKVSGAEAGAVSAVQATGFTPGRVMACSFTLADLSDAIAAGYDGCTLISTGTAGIASAVSAGATWVGMSETASDADFAAWHAAGLKVGVYTVNSRIRRDELLALGTISAIWTDDIRYLQATTPLRTTDDYASGIWAPGMFAGADPTNLTSTNRGRFVSPSSWGYASTAATSYYCLQGYLCPVKGDEAARDYTLAYSVKFVSASSTTRFAGVWLNASDLGFEDDRSAGENGYAFLARKTGQLTIYKVTAGVLGSAINSVGITAIADNETVKYNIVVASGTITFNRLNSDGSVNYSVSISDSAFGCGYIHFGRAGLNCQFSAVSVV
jgi:glycerophosphoryl diester phosphodiesterase